MFSTSIGLAIGCSAVMLGCLGNGDEGGSQEIVDNLVQAGFAASDIRVVAGKVWVGNDAEVSLQSSRERLESPPGKEHFRTTNLVGGPNPTVICVNGAAFTNAVLSQGLDLALGNYNTLFNAGFIRLVFVRVTGGPIAGCTFFINGFIQAGLTGGFSGFPSGGAPFGSITIGAGLVPFGLDVAEHVITHELGHCIGLAHTDAISNASCGGPPGSGTPLGLTFIMGTPSVDPSSLMNRCFSSNANGELSAGDVLALNILY